MYILNHQANWAKFLIPSPHLQHHNDILSAFTVNKILISILPHLFRKITDISPNIPVILWLRTKNREKKRKEGDTYEEQQPDQRSPGPWGDGQVQDAGRSGRWWSSYLLNYNRIIQNNSNQRLVSKSIVVHSIKNFIRSSFFCYIHKQEIQFSSHARRSAFYEHGFFTCHIAHFIHLFALKKDAYLCNVPNFPTSQKFFEKDIKKWPFSIAA